MGDILNHPYHPLDLQLSGYVGGFLSQAHILCVYGVASVLVVSVIWIISGRCSKLFTIDRVLMCWWAFTGLTHIILEGYFVFSPEFYKMNSPFYLAEVWKEYSKGDSRYAGRDSAVVTIEGITAVVAGPASLLAVYAIAAEGDKFSASRFYYWAYFIVANSFWLVIPTLISIRCWKKINEAFCTEKTKRI